MSDLKSETLERFGVAAYQPATFLDRGVTVPFTTPFLLGARIRPNESRAGLEVVIANPSGGRGFYVVPWPALPEICSPTLHDRRLWQRLSDQVAVTPPLVREMAALGGGGRARRARGGGGGAPRPQRGRRGADARQLHAAARPDPPHRDAHRGGGAAAGGQPAAGRAARPARGCARGAAAGGERRDHRRLARTARTAFCGVGVPGDATVSRTRTQANWLERMVAEVELWVARSPDPSEQHAAVLVADAARLTLQCATAAFKDLDGLLSDTPTLLRHWGEDSNALTRRATRPDWLLDGWQIICELWRESDTTMRANTLWEMALLAPILPREVEDWFGIEEDWDRPTRMRRVVRANEDWRSGRMLDIIARNERLRARMA